MSAYDLQPVRKLRLRRVARRLALGALAVVSILWVAWLLLPKPDLLPPALMFSRQVLDRDGRLLHIALTPDGKYRLPVSLNDVSPQLIAATLAKEDRRYFSHHGVDAKALGRAIWGVMSGQRLGGGSTISMQVARIRWQQNTRSYFGKVEQMFRAIQLERHYGKAELLEAYLTLAPYGGNVEGAAAAAQLWCGKSVGALTDREAAALAVLPQSPTTRKPRLDGNPALAAAMGRLLAQMRGQSSPMDAHYTIVPPPTPRRAPHLARRVLESSPDGSIVHSTLDRRMQQIAEASMVSFLSRQRNPDVRNGAMLVVHAPTREARAYVGSADFFNERIEGQVDGVMSRRSPGSALKPFIYALALDAGLIHPGTLLDDAPRQFGEYNPENSDRAYHGPTPAGEALRRSRNLPAVELLARLPNGGLDSWLRDADVRLDRPSGEYGLSLALGGAEVSMEELARLYASLADDGASRTIRFHDDTPASIIESRTMLTPAARWLTLESLRSAVGDASRGLAWKTGTSHGFRDAWACGAIGEWVVVVWIGNQNGTPMPGKFARDTAAPLLFETITKLGLGARARPRPRPREVVSIATCADSGMVAGPYCAHVCQQCMIAGVSPVQECDVHRRVYLNSAGYRVLPSDPTGRAATREFWPQHRLEQFRRAGLPRMEPPAWMQGSEPVDAGGAPRILSPQSGMRYVVQSADPQKRFIPLKASAPAESRRLHWFAGSQYLGSSMGSQPFLWAATPGRWTLQATDDFGHAASVQIQVHADL